MSVDPSQAAAAERLIGEIRAEVVRAHEETGRRLEAGDTGSLGEFHDKVEKAKADVRGLAFFIGSKVFGDKVWQRHNGPVRRDARLDKNPRDRWTALLERRLVE